MGIRNRNMVVGSLQGKGVRFDCIPKFFDAIVCFKFAYLKVWAELSEDAKKSNRRQAADMPRKLSALGYMIMPDPDPGAPAFKFSEDEIEILAPMEHESWIEEKIMNGWTYGKTRNDALKVHNGLLPWEELTNDVKDYDYEAVEAIPEILKGVGFVVVRVDAWE